MQAQLEAILNFLDEAIVCLDDSQQVVFLNAAAARLFDTGAPGQAGRPVADFLPLARLLANLKSTELTLPHPGARTVRRQEFPRADGGRVPLEITLGRHELAGRRLLTVVCRDVSWQQQMEAALQQARKHQALGALAGGIAHDFNNVLTAVISQLDLASDSPDCPPSLKANLNYAQASARRGAEMVSRLQMFNRQTRPRPGPVNPQEVVEQVAFILRRSIDPRVQLSTAPPPPPPWWVSADFAQLMQAVVNLGLWAADAMPSGGKISLETNRVTIAPVEARPPKRPGDFVRISMSNTGHALPSDLLACLADPDPSAPGFIRGLGLGLSASSDIVTQAGGWMEAENLPGSGSVLHLFLPRAADTQAQPPAPESNAPAARTLDGRESILVVDDEEAVRTVIRAVLAFRGYQVVEAVDGEDAVAKYTASPNRFNLVFMDLNMPRLNGQDAIAKIIEHDPKAKIVLLSGSLEQPALGAGDAAKRVRFLPKPFQNQELVEIARQMLDAP